MTLLKKRISYALAAQLGFCNHTGGHTLHASGFTRCKAVRITSTSPRFFASAEKSQSAIGFLGLGIMGLPMAQNLIQRTDSDLVVWNRTTEKVQMLLDSTPGARVRAAESPKEVIERCKTSFVMLSTPDAVREVFEGKGGALRGLSSGKAVVDCSTLTVNDARRNADAVARRGGLFLEAPVSGSKGPAETGQLIFLCAGSKHVFQAVESCLDAMGKKKFYYGAEVGKGTQMKLIVNMIMGAMLATLAEGITLAEKLDMSAEQLVDVLGEGAMSNPMFALKGPKMGQTKKDFTVNFPLEHAQKDLRFACLLADSYGLPLPVSSAANELYKAAKGMGLSRYDFSAVIESLRASSDRSRLYEILASKEV